MKDLHATRRLAAVLLAFSLGLAGCAASPPERADRARSAVPGEATSDVLLAAALRQFGQGDAPQALSYVALAAEKEPERADIAWLHSRLCAAAPGCEPQPLDSRLRRLDPDNAAAWLGALESAQAAGDRAAEERILEAIARAPRFDFYWNPLVASAAVALSRNDPTRARALRDPLTESLDAVVGWMSSLASRSLQPITHACGPQRTTNREHAVRCARVAEVLLKGDSFLVEGVGLGIAERVLAPGTTGAQSVAERIELSRYRRERAGAIIAAQVDKARFSAEMIELMRKLRREQDVFLAVLRWAGEPLEPAE